MHGATTTNPCTSHPHGANGQVLRMVERETVRGNTPAGIERNPQLARISDAIAVLKAKRDRYKGRNKMIQARTVQACTDELRGVWK